MLLCPPDNRAMVLGGLPATHQLTKIRLQGTAIILWSSKIEQVPVNTIPNK